MNSSINQQQTQKKIIRKSRINLPAAVFFYKKNQKSEINSIQIYLKQNQNEKKMATLTEFDFFFCFVFCYIPIV